MFSRLLTCDDIYIFCQLKKPTGPFQFMRVTHFLNNDLDVCGTQIAHQRNKIFLYIRNHGIEFFFVCFCDKKFSDVYLFAVLSKHFVWLYGDNLLMRVIDFIVWSY